MAQTLCAFKGYELMFITFLVGHKSRLNSKWNGGLFFGKFRQMAAGGKLKFPPRPGYEKIIYRAWFDYENCQPPRNTFRLAELIRSLNKKRGTPRGGRPEPGAICRKLDSCSMNSYTNTTAETIKIPTRLLSSISLSYVDILHFLHNSRRKLRFSSEYVM